MAPLLAVILLPGIGASDRRIPIDPNTPPWTAVAKLQVASVSRCTAVLVAPSYMATAAHCLTKPSLGHFVQPGSIHLLLGYDAGAYTRHIIPDAIILHPGATPATRAASPTDLALLHLPTPLPNPIPLALNLPPNTQLRLAGYNQDRAQRLELDPACHLRATIPGPLIAHDCDATHGSSGGPLLTTDSRLAAIQVAGNPAQGGYAIPAATIAALLPPNPATIPQ